MKNKHCEWCDNQFFAALSYQIYCSVECREAATKEKIAERYLLVKIKNRIGKERKCKSCGTNLSIYNDDVICKSCSVNPTDVSKALKDLKGLSDGKD
jgi:uncharacterized Zn finger protein (UPF0148 family)